MKKQILSALAIAILSFNHSSIAQEDDEVKTLLGDGIRINTENLGFFVAPSYGLTSLDGSIASLFNVRAGLSFNDKFSFGGFYNTSLNQINPESETIQDVYMDYWTAGGFIEYTILSKNIFHLTFPLYIGYSEVQMDNENGDTGLGESNFLQVEPVALLEININKFARFNIGTGYRFVSNMDYRNFNQSDISGFTGFFGFKFGLFK